MLAFSLGFLSGLLLSALWALINAAISYAAIHSPHMAEADSDKD